MAQHRKRVHRTIALFPNVYGFGFAVFEGPLRLVEWGTKHLKGAPEDVILDKIDALFSWFEPDTCVVENVAGQGPWKSDRVKKLIRRIIALAEGNGIDAHSYSRAQIRQAFEKVGARTKQEIAEVIAGDYEELMPILPQPKKVWENEVTSMGMFDAASLALAHFHFRHIETNGG